MNILLISQCNKRALTETRRILDQFAERAGKRTWQTHITQQGLDTLKRLLKQSARKNTAVACHWIRGRDHTELLWIVGNANFFNEKGRVPTDKTKRNILRNKDENDWHSLQTIKIFSAIAGLFHDFGKANKAFQDKLKNKNNISDTYRHEWVSLRLFESFVRGANNDFEWLQRLASLNQVDILQVQKHCLHHLVKDGPEKNLSSPFCALPPIAKIIGWLVVTHHFLPEWEDFALENLENILDHFNPKYGYQRMDTTNFKACWEFLREKNLPFSSFDWRNKASYWGSEALKYLNFKNYDYLSNLYTLHLSRLCLIFADHHYSNLPSSNKYGDSDFPLYANTDSNGNLKQRLDEHLIGVARNAKWIANSLPLLEGNLPSVKHHKGFKRRANEDRFRWQDRAFDLAFSLRDQTHQNGFFGINMASTGSGKTLANGRIMYALSNPIKGTRFVIALGLRVLTLQTGQAYRDRLNLEDDDLAVLVGSAAIRELFEDSKKETRKQKKDSVILGSESAESIEPDNSYVHFDGSLEIGLLKKWLANKHPNVTKLIAAPILVCTIDHLIGATEGTRAGKQIAPMLRLMTSDLILDEPDDFDIKDLPALTRLVHWAGMLGSRVLLSSATLPPSLIEGLFNAYQAGRHEFRKARGDLNPNSQKICCAWFDENQSVGGQYQESCDFASAHQEFINQRVQNINQAEVRRRAQIRPLEVKTKNPADVRLQVAEQVRSMIYDLHERHHEVDPFSQKKVSFGLVRFANIDPLIDIVKNIVSFDAKEDYQLIFCCYHSRHPLVIRNEIEKQLDNFLNRSQPESIYFSKPDLQTLLRSSQEKNIIFLVFASPVAEVGRDHDYDWAIVEPSSLRSIIQLAGRVRRHRVGDCRVPNIYLLNTNIKSLESANSSLTYIRPGFEADSGSFRLLHKNLEALLLSDQYEIISSIPRILPPPGDLKSQENLVALEHARLGQLMKNQFEMNGGMTPVNVWWEKPQATFFAGLQKRQRFRDDPLGKQRFALLFDESENECWFDIESDPPVSKNNQFKDFGCVVGRGVKPWGNYNYTEMISKLAEEKNMDLNNCAKKYGYIDLPKERDGDELWYFHLKVGVRRFKS